jgi:hypothetical protein
MEDLVRHKNQEQQPGQIIQDYFLITTVPVLMNGKQTYLWKHREHQDEVHHTSYHIKTPVLLSKFQYVTQGNLHNTTSRGKKTSWNRTITSSNVALNTLLDHIKSDEPSL